MSQVPKAAVMVLDYYPDDEEIEDLAYGALEDFTDENASAKTEVVYKAPEWMDIGEQDQINAFVRDGVKGTCVLVIYMSEGDFLDEEEDTY